MNNVQKEIAAFILSKGSTAKLWSHRTEISKHMLTSKHWSKVHNGWLNDRLGLIIRYSSNMGYRIGFDY